MTPEPASSSHARVAEAPQAPTAAAPTTGSVLEPILAEDDDPTFFAIGKDGCHAVKGTDYNAPASGKHQRELPDRETYEKEMDEALAEGRAKAAAQGEKAAAEAAKQVENGTAASANSNGKDENVATDIVPEWHQMGIDGTCTTVKLTGNEQPTSHEHKRDLPDRETYEREMDEALAEGRAKAAAQGEKAAAEAAEEPKSRWNGEEYDKILAEELAVAKQKVLELWNLQKQAAIDRAHARAENVGMSIKPPRPAIHWDIVKDETMPKGWQEDRDRFGQEQAEYNHALRIEDYELEETEKGMFVEREKDRGDALAKEEEELLAKKRNS